MDPLGADESFLRNTKIRLNKIIDQGFVIYICLACPQRSLQRVTLGIFNLTYFLTVLKFHRKLWSQSLTREFNLVHIK